MGSVLGRVRFAALWLVAGSALAGTLAVFFYEPGVLEEGVAGVMEGDPVTMGMAQVMAALVALPLVMAVVTLFVPVRAGAIANLVAGVPLGVFGLYAAVPELVGGGVHAHLLLSLLAVVSAWLIVGLSIAELRPNPRGHAASAPVGAGSSAQ